MQNTWSSQENVVECGVAPFEIKNWFDNAPIPLDSADDGFERWAATQTDNTASQFTFSFFENGSDFYFEAGDITTIFAIFGSVPDYEGVVQTTKFAEFELVGAASLVATFSAILS